MGFFILVLLGAIVGGVVGFIEEIGPLIGPCLVFSLVITGITLLITHIKGKK